MRREQCEVATTQHPQSRSRRLAPVRMPESLYMLSLIFQFVLTLYLALLAVTGVLIVLKLFIR